MKTKEKETEENEREEELESLRDWSDLPGDLLGLIVANLFAGDRGAFHAVCRPWRSATTAKLPLPPPTDSPYFDSPCLMFSLQSNCMWKLFHSTYNEFYLMDLPELLGAEIRFSKYGWLLMSRVIDKSWFFFNPVTKVPIELPRCGVEDEVFSTMCFSSPPTSSDCLVVGIENEIRDAIIGVLRRGESSWNVQTYPHDCEEFDVSHCHIVSFHGLYYCLDNKGDVGMFDAEDDEWTVFPILQPEIQEKLHQRYLVEVDGDILAVFVLHDEERCVHVMKLNLSEHVWEPVSSLGDKMLFVSRSASFAETATIPCMSNKIYFPKLYDNSGVFYSMTSQKFYSFDGKFDGSKVPYGLQEYRFGTWFKPAVEAECDENFKW